MTETPFTNAHPAGASAGLVLAAGGSRRLGRPKQLLPVEGRPLLELVLTRVCASKLDEVAVVLGAHAEEISRAVGLGRSRVILNPDYHKGMSSSLRAGVLSLGKGVSRLVVILGDQPDISATLIDELLSLHQESGLPAAALSLEGMLHPPVVLNRSLWGELLELEGDVGCRAVIRGRPDLVAALPFAGRQGHPVDIDTLADYQHLLDTGG